MKKLFGWLIALGLLTAPLRDDAARRSAGIGGVGVGDPGYYGQDYGYGYGYGPAPVCQWGYYNYYPYSCAPYGFYGPKLVYRRPLHRRRPVVPRLLGSWLLGPRRLLA